MYNSYFFITAVLRKLPQNSEKKPWTYIFQRAFLRGLCREGNLHFKIDQASLWLEGNLPFLLCFTLYLSAISKYKPPGAYIRRSNLTVGFCFKGLGGLNLEGLIFGILQYSTLDSHTNTVISYAVACLSRWLPKPWHSLLFISWDTSSIIADSAFIWPWGTNT